MKMSFKQYLEAVDAPKVLYHITRPENVDSILEKGLLAAHKKTTASSATGVYLTNSWKDMMTNPNIYPELSVPYKECAVFQINGSKLDAQVEDDPEFSNHDMPGLGLIYPDDIPPEALTHLGTITKTGVDGDDLIWEGPKK